MLGRSQPGASTGQTGVFTVPVNQAGRGRWTNPSTGGGGRGCGVFTAYKWFSKRPRATVADSCPPCVPPRSPEPGDGDQGRQGVASERSAHPQPPGVSDACPRFSRSGVTLGVGVSGPRVRSRALERLPHGGVLRGRVRCGMVEKKGVVPPSWSSETGVGRFWWPKAGSW